MAFIQSNTVSSLHTLIADLRTAGYNGTIAFEYNGSGDSGEVYAPTIETQMQGTLDALGWCMEYAKGGYTYANNNNSFVNNDPNHDRCLLSLVNELLPGGWEINEGSHGEVVIDIDNDKIIVKHNQNITTTEYSEETY